MAALASYQKLTRVISSPWGTGADGAYSSATIPTLVKLSVAGVATETHFHATAGQFVANDIVLLHQTRGTGVGQWEINMVTVDTSGTYTVSKALQYTYTDSGASQAQVIKIPQYTDVTVQSGTWTVPSWDGDVGGILVFACKGDLTVTGTISGSAAGHIGGAISTNLPAACGEGSGGASANQREAMGNSGGGGVDNNWALGAGGGGNATTGGASENNAGYVGGESGSADLLNLTLGGAGGAGGGNNWSESTRPGKGGNGAGGIFIFAKNVASINSITLNGGAGDNASSGGSGYRAAGGGGGAGGSCIIECNTATLGTEKIAVAAGTAGTKLPTDSGYSGAGSVGRIAVHHSGAITGTTTPSFTDVTDATLVEASGGGMFFAML